MNMKISKIVWKERTYGIAVDFGKGDRISLFIPNILNWRHLIKKTFFVGHGWKHKVYVIFNIELAIIEKNCKYLESQKQFVSNERMFVYIKGYAL
jgi:hypothetical protein